MAKHKKMVRIALQNAMLLQRLRLRRKHRYWLTQFGDSTAKLFEVLSKVKSPANIEKEISANVAAWVNDISEIVEEVRKAVPDLTRR